MLIFTLFLLYLRVLAQMSLGRHSNWKRLASFRLWQASQMQRIIGIAEKRSLLIDIYVHLTYMHQESVCFYHLLYGCSEFKPITTDKGDK